MSSRARFSEGAPVYRGVCHSQLNLKRGTGPRTRFTMFASIEVLIGLALVYLLLALIVTAFTEWFSSLFRYRARNLRTAVQQMLDGPAGTANTQRFFSHPRIVALSEGIKPPSYVPAKAFAE